ncbi:MAG: hypothetical protein R6U29_07690 [Desulfosudaceae bacterium]
MNFFDKCCFISAFQNYVIFFYNKLPFGNGGIKAILYQKNPPFGRVALGASASLADIRGRSLQLHIGRLAAAPKSTREISGLTRIFHIFRHSGERRNPV